MIQDHSSARDRFGELLGMEVLSADDDRVKVRGVVRPEHTNAFGTAHGGFLYSLADVAFARAVNTSDRAGVGVTTHMESHLPATEGEAVVAESSNESLGNRLATFRVDIRRERDEALIASFTGTAYLKSHDPGAADGS